MTSDDYVSHMMTVYLTAKALAEVPVKDMLQAIDRSDALGPILHPTMWRDGEKAMHEDREALQAALPLALLGRMLTDRVLGLQVKP